jgi:hypothetical protein
MNCPYCFKDFHMPKGGEAKNHFHLKLERGYNHPWHYLDAIFCPACDELIVIYTHPLGMRTPYNPNPGGPGDRSGVILPRNPSLRPLPPEVPDLYRSDFDQARLVIELSPKSSAALSRRILQSILHDQFTIKAHNLQKEIAEFIETIHPPQHLGEQLDAIRAVGNFAAHPLKDTATGLIQDVEPGEAEWLIETLESLFDFAFVQPAKTASRKAALNAKLAASGKPLID